MKTYPHDSSASAVVLADYGEAYFTYSNQKGFQLNLDRLTRIKILNKNGLEYANQQVALYHRANFAKEEIKNLKATTYNLEGNKIKKYKIDGDGIYKEAYNENIDLIKFTLPNVKEGSVIEFKYTVKSDFIYNLFTWEFQSGIPVQWSEFRARIPQYFQYKNLMGGFLPVTLAETTPYKDSFSYRYKENDGEMGKGSVRGERVQTATGVLKPEGIAYRWVMEKAPAIKQEAYITTIKDYLSKIEFELSFTQYPGDVGKAYSSSWEKLADKFLKDMRFGGQLGRATYLKDVVAPLQAQASGADLVGLIVQYAKQNFHYNGRERVYTQDGVKKAFEKKEGNAAEINLLLTLMLREAGFQANPVILSTRSHGRVNPVIPLEQDFNFVVAHLKLDEGEILLDATSSSLPVGMLPYECLNQQGRLISESFTTWVPLLSNELFKEASQVELSLSATGGLTGQMTRKHEGFSAVNNRKEYQEKGEEKYLKEEYSDRGWIIDEFSIENSESLSDELVEKLSFHGQGNVTVAGDRMYFKPLLLESETENPFKLEQRNFPVDLGCPIEDLSMVRIKLPDGYTVEEVPEPLVLALPDKSGTFRYVISQAGNELTIVNSLKFAKPIYMPAEYPALKQFYDMIMAKQAEQVVLKKMN